jgi:RimJ/RimL family protein N-acetyltransferase
MAPVLADPALYAYIGGSPPSEPELEARYRRQTRGVSPDGRDRWLNWVLRLRAEGRLVGFVQATVSERDGITGAEISWVLGRRDQGAGLATEAARAATAWLRTACGVAVLSARIHPENVASAAVARRLGLVATPIVEDGEFVWTSDERFSPE